MKYFEKDFIDFFIELSQNNHKEWFDENRKRYEQIVKEPFKKFVGDLAAHLSQYDPQIELDPKHLIFRINRDIRFSKDKRPYKTFVSAVISKGGKKDKSATGLYFELSPDGIGIYGGAWNPDKTQLEDIRFYIVNHLNEFQKLLADKAYINNFGTLQGDKNVRIPKELQESVKKEPLIANKQFYHTNKLSVDLITSDHLIKKIEEQYLAMKAVNDFLNKALGI